jgi:hypothetical protein
MFNEEESNISNVENISEEKEDDDDNEHIESSDTSVIAITCHGSLNPSEDNYIVIPEGIEVIKINSSYIGVPACTNITDMNMIVNNIVMRYEEFLNKDENIFDRAIDHIVSIIKRTNNSMSKRFWGRTIEPYYREYVLRSRESVYVEYLKPGDRIINKKYERNFNEKTKKKGYDYSIPIISNSRTMNVDNYRDLFSGIGIPSHNKEIVYLQSIIEYFSYIGKTKLVIFDLSCSTFHSDNVNYTPRDVRHERFNLTHPLNPDNPLKRTRYTGGKNKNKSRKNKSRKNKNKSRKNKNKSRKNKNKSRKNKNKLGKK